VIENLIDNLIQDPTDQNKELYLSFVNEMEYSLLEEAEIFPFKSQEYFNKRTEAFAYRRECAKMLLPKWIAAYGSTEGCVVSYADTLNIPFQQIKEPK
jgi:hypothetical protein